MIMACKVYNKIDEIILEGLHIINQPSVCEEIDKIEEPPVLPQINELFISTSTNCSYCQVQFKDVQEQRAHYKLDWHRYNLKQALQGLPSLPEEKFSNVADDVSSISGSESESEDSEDELSDREKAVGKKIACFRDAKIFLENASGNAFSLYKCLLLRRREVPTVAEVQELTEKFLRSPKKKWLIVMLGGGHFAAAVFENSSITVHKTFHCYTVRAKQGGSQSSRDNKSGGGIKSAGASLRRYNEMALAQHVQDIMSSWTDEIAQCSLILYRAVGPHNGRVLFGGKAPPFDKSDVRLRSIPLVTRRATLKEVKRVHDMLSTLQFHGPSVQLKDQIKSPETEKPANPNPKSLIHNQVDQHFDTVRKKISPRVDRGKERPSPEREIPGLQESHDSDSEGVDIELITEELEVDFSNLKEEQDTVKETKWQKRRARKKLKMEKKRYTEEIEGLMGKIKLFCQTGNEEGIRMLAETAKSWPSRCTESTEIDENGLKLRKEDFDDCLKNPLFADHDRNTLLHIAAMERFPNIITTLLELGCDPAIRNRKNQVPYELSGDQATKEAFKEFVTKYPDKYNRRKSHIPEALTEEQKKEMEEKKKERKKQQKVRQKIKGKEQREKDLEEQMRTSWLSETDITKVSTTKDIFNAIKTGKTPPAPLRCFQCGVQIPAKPKPFEYNECMFCTLACLKIHRNSKKAS